MSQWIIPIGSVGSREARFNTTLLLKTCFISYGRASACWRSFFLGTQGAEPNISQKLPCSGNRGYVISLLVYCRRWGLNANATPLRQRSGDHLTGIVQVKSVTAVFLLLAIDSQNQPGVSSCIFLLVCTSS